MKTITLRVAAVLMGAAFGGAAVAAEQGTARTDAASTGKPLQATQKTGVQNQPARASNARNSEVGEVRDWAAIDKNKDNLISPEEMEAELNRGKKQP
jgi:hypothetical protein